jgi:SAM-dependent methyltransferase
MAKASAAQRAPLDYYDGPELTDTIFDALRAAGLDTERLDLAALASLDEFHALGRNATVALVGLSGIRRGEAVLDVGAGIGGPARVLAHHYGARVTALDSSARFCRACERLCAATGLSDRVRVVHGDALSLPFEDAGFDVVWTQAVMQNIGDKPALLAELRRMLRPGGRLALFEVLSGPGGPVRFPVPWGDGPGDSFLVDGEQLRDVAQAAGFEPLLWNQGEAAVASVLAGGTEADGAVAPAAQVDDRGIGLELLMPDFEARMAGLATNVAERRIELVQAVLVAR